MEDIKERWKPIEDYPQYTISTLGSVKNRKGKILKSFDTYGYDKIKLVNQKTGKRKLNQIHRLVAIAFIPRIEGKNEVNHINKIKNDNRVENLEWINRSDNMKYIHKGMISLYTINELYLKNPNIPLSKFIILLKEKASK